MMKMDKENQETLNVELSSDEKKKASNNGSTSTRQLYVHVRRRKAKRQYRRNQDAINFLRRFTLGVVIIDLILAISESSLISTFFLFLTLSTTFDVKPENVLDTYCYYYQGGGNSMCEQYMEGVTGYTTQKSSSSNHYPRSSQSSPAPENHFPTIPKRPPLTPTESRKLFLAYNQSLFDSPARFNLEQKIDKDSRLSILYSRLIYLFFENNNGLLNDHEMISEILKNENRLDNLTDSPGKSQRANLQSLILKNLKQSIEIISPYTPLLPLPPKGNDYLLFHFCSKALDHLKAIQRLKPRRKDESKQLLNFTSAEAGPVNNPFRKNLIQPTDFIRHRWKRALDGKNSSETVTNISSSATASPSGHHELDDHTSAPVTFGTTTTATGSKKEKEEGKATNYVGDVKQKKQRINGHVSASTKEWQSRGNGYRLIKGQANNKKLVRDFKSQEETRKEGISAQSKSRRDVSRAISQNDFPSSTNRTRQYYKQDLQLILTEAEANLNKFMMGNGGNLTTNQDTGLKNGRQTTRKLRNNSVKYLEELALGLDKNPRHVLALMEATLFHNWQRFVESSKRLSVHARVDSGTPVGERDEPLIWLSVRKKIIESMQLNMEMNVFSPETTKKAERRKRAMEQIYHDYSSTILRELKDAKDMPVSSTFLGLYWAIKLYVMVWHTTVCSVLFFGSIFEDKTSLNIWCIFNILTSFLHFIVDEWINANIQPQKTAATIWFGVVYGAYKPMTILLVATLSAEIFKRSGGKKKGLLERISEVVKGRKRPPIIDAEYMEKLRGLFITPESCKTGNENGDCKKNPVTSMNTSGDNNNGGKMYCGIKSVKIRAKIKRLEVSKGILTVITHTTQAAASIAGEKTEETTCTICGTPHENGESKKDCSGIEDEKIFEGRVFYPSASIDNEAGLSADDLYPDETEDEEEDEDELEEVADDEDDDESDEEDDGDNEECCHHHNHVYNVHDKETECGNGSPSSKAQEIIVISGEKLSSRVELSPEERKRAEGDGETNPEPGHLSLISYAGNGIQGNLLQDTNSRTRVDLGVPILDVLHGPVVDGGNFHI